MLCQHGFARFRYKFRTVSPRFRAVSERSERFLYIKVGCIGAASVRSRLVWCGLSAVSAKLPCVIFQQLRRKNLS